MRIVRVGLLAGLMVGSSFAQEINSDKAYQSAMELLAEGQQNEAENLVEEACVSFPKHQRLLFLQGVLERSRFHRSDTFKIFSAVHALDANTAQGQAAMISSSLDFDMEIEAGLERLQKLIKTYPDEILFRWLFAIQCRSHRKHSEAAEAQYRIILDHWDPGPVMVNHTYANILTESLGRPEDALVYRKKALAQVQRGFVYQGYANTLRELGRYEEAGDAFEKAVEISPRSVAYWRQWGACLMESGQVKEAYAVLRNAYEMGHQDSDILTGLGRANEKGRGTAQNDEQALGWYQLAATKGSGEAMYRLGQMRADGRGDSKDYTVAAAWFRKSIAVDYDRSYPNLARLYAAGGYGLDRDLREVEKLFLGLHPISSLQGGPVRVTKFAGLFFILNGAPDDPSGLLDYDKTCRTLNPQVDEERDLLAWMYSVMANPDPKLKGAAVGLAEELCQKDRKNPQWKNTLAAAYARDGQFDQAIEQQQRALELLAPHRKDTEEGRAYIKRLELYKSGISYTAYCGEKSTSSPGLRASASPAKPPGEAYLNGSAFERGEGCEKDYAAALECYQKAAEEGDPTAWQICKILQKGGFGVDRNLERAAASYAKWGGTRSVPENTRYVRVHKLFLSFSDRADDGQDGHVEYGMTISSCKETMDDKASLELLAWIYATCKNPRYRNGAVAVRLSEKLCRDDEKNPQWRNTLAAAYARVGKYEEAVEQQEKAMALLPENQKTSPEGTAYSRRLELYRTGHPFPPGE